MTIAAAAAIVAACVFSPTPQPTGLLSRAWIEDLSAGRWQRVADRLAPTAKIVNADGTEGTLSADRFLTYSAQERVEESSFSVREQISDGESIEALRVTERIMAQSEDHIWIVATDRGCVVQLRRY